MVLFVKETISITYKETVRNYISDVIEHYGGTRKAGDAVGIDPSVLCRIKKGKYTPKPQTIAKYFPDFDFGECSDFSLATLPINKTEIVINCQELKDLERQLNSIGYEIRYTIVKKGKS